MSSNQIDIKLTLGQTPTLKQLEREYFEIKMMMLQSSNPQEQKRLSNCLKSIKRCMSAN